MIITNDAEINMDTLLGLSKEAGFSHAAPLNMDSLVFRPEVRAMCAEDLCRSYGRSWSCPPAVGSLEVITARAAKYKRGIIAQTVGQMRREIDFHSVVRINQEHVKNFASLVRQVRTLYPGCLPMGAGACTLCRRCTYPDSPCRHPDKMIISMEAYGLLVNDVCKRSGLEYNYGPQTMSFTSCILID